MAQVTKNQSQTISAEIDEAVKAILKKHNMEVVKVRGKYGDVFGYSIEASVVNNNDNGVNVSSPSALDFIQHGKMYGFENPVDALGKTFTTQGKTYKFIGTNSNASKFVVSAIDVKTNKQFGFTLVALRKLEGFNADLVPLFMRDQFQLVTEAK